MNLEQIKTESYLEQMKKLHHIPGWQIFLMRLIYFLTFSGLVYENWSIILFPDEQMDVLSGVAISFWASYALLMGIGVRHPLKMIPLLMLQLIYKSAWILGTYIPASGAKVVSENMEMHFRIFVVAIVLDLVVIPWTFVFNNYFKDFFKVKWLKKLNRGT